MIDQDAYAAAWRESRITERRADFGRSYTGGGRKPNDALRERVREALSRGLTRNAIAQELHVARGAVDHHAEMIAREH